MANIEATVSDSRTGRTRAIVLLGLAIILGLTFFFWPSRPNKVEARIALEGNSETRVERASAAPAPSVAALVPNPSAPPPEPPPVIDEVLVEKPEVCSGEENLITVRAHTANGTNEFLHTVIDGSMGAAVPVRLSLGEDGNIVGQHSISVFGRTNMAVTVPLPKYRVKDCQPAQILLIEQRLRPNTNSDFDFHARVITLPPRGHEQRSAPEAYRAVSFAWTFGDGTSESTSAPLASHSFENRPQETLYSYFVVGVEARDQNGKKLAGRTAIPLINPAFEAFARKGIVQILMALEPRFPTLDAEGRVTQRVRLWHTRPDNVTIENAIRTDYFESGAGQRQPQRVEPAQLLGTTTIPPGKAGIETTVVLDTEANPGVFSITYQLIGKSSDGHPALGSFSVMKPPPKPTRENSDPVADPNLEAKIRAAREILHQDVVTDDDLWRLEREGKFANLTTTNGQQGKVVPANAAPPAMPAPDHVNAGPPVPTAAAAAPVAPQVNSNVPSK